MQSTLEYPKGSGILIRPLVNKTKNAAFGGSSLVILPLKLSKEVWSTRKKDGKRRRIPERKQFATLQEAKNFASERSAGHNAVGSKFIHMDHGDRNASVRLVDAIKERGSEAQSTVDDVIAALKLMGTSQAVNLAQCVQFALPRLAPASGVKTVAECAESYLASLTGQVSPEHERTTKVYVRRLTAKYGLLPVSQLDAPKINDLVAGLKKRDRKERDGTIIPGKAASPKFRQHIRAATCAVLKHAIAKGWLTKGVMDFEDVQTPRNRRAGAIEVFTPTELEALLTQADAATDEGKKPFADLIPFLTIGGFSGLRSAEIERLDWRHIDLVQGHIEITAANAKTASRRIVPVVDNLKLWLTPLHKGEGRVFALSTSGGNVTERLNKLAIKAGLPRWKKNALRHSFISYRVAKVQNVAQVALEAGNSPQVIFSNYRSVVTPAEAEKYFALAPAQPAENVVSFADAVAQ